MNGRISGEFYSPAGSGSGLADPVPALKERVESYILSNGLLKRGDSALVGLSGGADSVALLTVLTRLAPKYGWQVSAAHFNHGIRGESADADEAFCRDLCEANGVPFYSEKADVPAYAKENGLSVETAGRILRYAFLEKVRKRAGACCIAVAHHMNDNAESILLHLLRGSGLAGLLGIKPKRDDIIRPLLGCSKEEIEDYLENEGVLYRTDETNLVPEGSRNRVRLELIPYIEKHVNPAIVETLCSMSELLLRDEEHLMKEARAAYESAKAEDGLIRSEVAALPYPIKTRVIRLALADAGALVDIERKHIEAIAELLSARTGARLTLPGIEARTSYDLIKFGRPVPVREFETPLREGLVNTPLGLFRIERIEGTEGFEKSTTVCFIDADKAGRLPDPLVIRTRRDGDRFTPVGAPGSKKLKEHLIDRKIEREKRSEIPLIASGSEVLFVTGIASSDTVKVDAGTKRMIKAEFLGRIDDGD